MNFRKTLLAGALALGLLGSIVAPAAIAQQAQDQTDVTVEITSTGPFAVMICNPAESAANNDLIPADVVLTQTSPPSLYADGLAEGTFTICYADNAANRGGFITRVSADDFTSGTGPTISNTRFKIVHTGMIETAPIVTTGSINYLVNADEVNVPVQDSNGAVWTTNNELSWPRAVHSSPAGSGVGGGGGTVDVILEIPAGSFGMYSSEITVDVIPVV